MPADGVRPGEVVKGQGADHQPDRGRNLKLNRQDRGRLQGPRKGRGTRGVPGSGGGVARDCWPEPSSQPGLSAWSCP